MEMRQVEVRCHHVVQRYSRMVSMLELELLVEVLWTPLHLMMEGLQTPLDLVGAVLFRR